MKLSENCVVITENNDSPLKRIANTFLCQILDFEEEIGGRYSVFSNVGLFPACLSGFGYIRKFAKGLRILFLK